MNPAGAEGVPPSVITANERSILLIAHTGRAEAVASARHVAERLAKAGITVRVLEDEAEALDCPGAEVAPMSVAAAEGAEMALVLGGDGTLLRAADLTRRPGTPLLGINHGHVGFLAEAELEDLTETVDRVVNRRYHVEERMTIDVSVRRNGTVKYRNWALNEATVEKASRERMVEVVAEVDGRPVSHWGCDGVVCATPTGSTAYAFSAGGPVVWPEVEAMLVVPISAHAMFARPLVVSPRSLVAFEVLPDTPGAVLWCDGRRTTDLPAGARIEVRRGEFPVRLARLRPTPFTDRLVTKFALPVSGWRGRTRSSERRD